MYSNWDQNINLRALGDVCFSLEPGNSLDAKSCTSSGSERWDKCVVVNYKIVEDDWLTKHFLPCN